MKKCPKLSSLQISELQKSQKETKNTVEMYADKKILLIWDNPGWHRGSVVQKYIEKIGNIELLYYPAYAPELNPQEHVWKQGRAHITNNRIMDNMKKISREFIRFLNSSLFKYSLLGFSAK